MSKPTQNATEEAQRVAEVWRLNHERNQAGRKQYRAVQYCADTDEIEAILHEGNNWKDAHFQCLQYDGDWWPEYYHVVERSLDGGQTWHEYSADEMINGRPAWTIDGI